jgi:hypothetical protein
MQRLGVTNVGQSNRGSALSGSILDVSVMPAIAPGPASSQLEPASRQPEPAARQPERASSRSQVSQPARAQTEPSWGQVLVNTGRLWFQWRLRLIRSGSARTAGKPARWAVWRWRLAAIVVALAIGAAAALAVTGTMSPAARVLPSSTNHAATSRAGAAGGNTTARDNTAATVRSHAAAWIASQVTTAAIIACEPVMCAALQAQGVTAGRLMPLPPGTANPGNAGIVVTSAPLGQLAATYAPALIATFGSGATRIDVRATEPGGAAAYAAALRADLAARKYAGSELLRNWRITFTAQDARQLRAGLVDSRLLATLAALASQYPIRVDAFSDAAPGGAAQSAATQSDAAQSDAAQSAAAQSAAAPDEAVPGDVAAGVELPFRAVTITITGGTNRTAGLSAAQALVRSQPAPYQPGHVTIADPAGPRAALNVEFAAPSPLGLLTAVLAADLHVTAG